MTLEALIFDMDGVITDSVELHYRAWQQLADEEGLPFNRAINEQLRGLARRASLNVILDGKPINEDTAHAFMTRKNQYFLELLQAITPKDTLPGIRELIVEARQQGLKVAIASSSRNTRAVLGRLELINLFDVIGDAHNVVHTKPAPDIFLWVAGRLDVHPQNALIIEDAEAGVQAAKSGGFKVVCVGEIAFPKADIYYPSFAGKTLEILLADIKALPTHV